jgi:hypothetical protein
MFGLGVVGVVGTVVLASRATLKLEEVLTDIENKKSIAETLRSKKNALYSEEDYRKDMVVLRLQMITGVLKLYGPAVLVGALSIAALTGSHVALARRNMALTAAYAAIEKGFKEYRSRVVKEYGEDKDRELRYGSVKKDIVEETATGPKVTTTKRCDPNEVSIYARFFDENNANFQREAVYNRIFLQCQQNYFNDILHSRGHVFLNEVYDALGMDRSRAGAVVGWVLSKASDNFVDFGIFNGNSPAVRDFVNGDEGAILLDFNVDGVIYDKI